MLLARHLRFSTFAFAVLASSSVIALEQNDPLEPLNRQIYSFNKVTDNLYIKPATTVYEKVLPMPAQITVANFLKNIGEVPVVANGLLQGKVDQALSDVLRFCINSTLGIFGLFDVATQMGIVAHKEDFGKTLYAWGWKDSSYFVIPILGPSTIRDTFGVGGNLYMSIPAYLKPKWRNRYYATNMIDRRKDLHELDKIAGVAGVEYYNLVRTSYFQHREFEFTGVTPQEDGDSLGEPPA